MDASDDGPTHVVIVGAGFAGLACARALRRATGFDVTLVDRNPYHVFSPLLYQVATGGLPEDDIAYPVRAAVPGVRFRRGEVVTVNLETRTVRLADGSAIAWDRLVLATGSIGTTFGIPGVAQNALQMKTIPQARAIRRRLLQTYEDVDLGVVPREELQVVVVGGGPTGVELAGAIAELQRAMRREFPVLADSASVTLVEAGDRLLPTFGQASSDRARRDLTHLGVHVRLGAGVERMHPGAVRLAGGEVLRAGTMIWAAGVVADPQWAGLGSSDRSHRLEVTESLRLTDDVWVLGDLAHVPGIDGRALPMVGSVALQMGSYVARSLVAERAGRPIKPFSYRDKGQMATVGRRRAVVELAGGIRLTGLIAWMAWLGLHLFYLTGGRQRVSVMADWVWNYLVWGVGPRRTVID